MAADPLDALLDASAPLAREIERADVRAMVADARAEVRAAMRKRRGAVLIGTLALLLVSGAGVAVATDGFNWGPWIREPVGAASFRMPNGFECELRHSKWTAGSDPAFIAEVNRTLEDWYRSTDVVAKAEAQLPAQRKKVAEMEAASGTDLDAGLSGLSPQKRADMIERFAFDREWMAWDLALSNLEGQALTSAGISETDKRFGGAERGGQIQCLDRNGKPYRPGAGS